ncbi:hypothetical protein COCMIDRAFT_95381 [Bipolaris oryzae ATCC 44560]|uniref:Heterokaryon incompatibility domain-containing protein n=1 Tax=Bipolaris oryzae ATCC 44560 TaxID=930090 RepID=W6ZDG2_COCMI|nr:uncharacterized protein COCMIDRAFT_95381 [Bipolaris oryzae ATCC 44560]EUC45494.1 hypothetical protein COCMIDRAFT_95381 [Bipolaris oryzae ATCC 44560]
MDIESLPASSGDQVSYPSRIRQWIEVCNSSHGDICIPKPISQQPQNDVPQWLIDTHDQCIVPGTSADHYLALSYTWPETRDSSTPAPRSLLLDAASIVDLQTPGCFSSSAIAEILPGVIRHAMSVTAALGERYLWVDRLCIVQNDAGTLDQVTRMDKIYAGAYLTIIAAAPDAMYQSDQLLEWPRFDMFLKRSKTSVLNRDQVVRTMDYRYQALRESRWATRGWTFQEQILCKRAVVFTEKGIFWDCQCCMWDGADLEPGQDYETISSSTDMGKRFATRWWPDFSFYVDLICPYNGREFSYPQDALLGFSGVLSALSRSFPGKFISGIPSIFLDHVLLWQPFEIAQRRVDRGSPSSTSKGVSSLPSWAWCGWQCFIDPTSLCSGLAYMNDDKMRKRAGSWQTQNLIEWYASNDLAQSELMSELPTFNEYAKLSSSPDTLPNEWQSHEEPSTEAQSFSHATDRKLLFRHPIPLSLDASRQPELCTTSYLTFKTNSALFLPATILRARNYTSAVSWGEAKVSVFEDRMFALGPREKKAPPVIVLQQPNGMFAGLLRHMNLDSMNPNLPVELIAISTGSANATDLESTYEWHVFAYRDLYYFHGNNCNITEFASPLLTMRQRRALLFDTSMAFSEESAKDNENSALIPELSAIEDEIDNQVRVEMEKNERKLLELNATQQHRMNYEQRVWFHFQKKVLEERRQRKGVAEESVGGAVCQFYNVLWIQRKEGVAYRVACGWVPKHVWEAHSKGPVKVVLG